MANSSELEDKANKYAADKLRELRGKMTRVKFGQRIGMSETTLFDHENNRTRFTIAKLVSIAMDLDVPLSTFIVPDHELLSEQEGDKAIA